MPIDLKKLYELAFEDGWVRGYDAGICYDGGTSDPPDVKGFEKCVEEATIPEPNNEQ